MELDAYRKMSEVEDGHWWFCGRRSVAEAVVRDLDLPNDASILEIGAGTGGNVAMLQRWGKVSAVEMSELARSIASERRGYEFLSGHLPDSLPASAGPVDLVCLFDVLEHVSDDVASLEAIHDILRPGGRVVLTVPAHQWLWSAHDVELHHFRRYSRAMLRQRIEEAGYHLDKLTFINAALFPVAVAARLTDRLRRTSSAAGQDTPWAPVNALMRRLFEAERRIVPRHSLPFGLSLLAVFSKTAKKGSVSHGEERHAA